MIRESLAWSGGRAAVLRAAPTPNMAAVVASVDSVKPIHAPASHFESWAGLQTRPVEFAHRSVSGSVPPCIWGRNG